MVAERGRVLVSDVRGTNASDNVADAGANAGNAASIRGEAGGDVPKN